jgi:hypothetical protein
MDAEKLEMQKVLKSIQESLSLIARRNATSPVNFATSTVPLNSSRRPLPPGSQLIFKPTTFLCLDTLKPIVQRHASLTNPLGEAAGSRQESRNNSAPPDAVDSPKTPGSALSSFESSGNSFAHFRASNGDAAPPFPDNLIGETELLIVAIKKFLAEIKDSGIGTNAMYHADSVSFD